MFFFAFCASRARARARRPSGRTHLATVADCEHVGTRAHQQLCRLLLHGDALRPQTNTRPPSQIRTTTLERTHARPPARPPAARLAPALCARQSAHPRAPPAAARLAPTAASGPRHAARRAVRQQRKNLDTQPRARDAAGARGARANAAACSRCTQQRVGNVVCRSTLVRPLAARRPPEARSPTLQNFAALQRKNDNSAPTDLCGHGCGQRQQQCHSQHRPIDCVRAMGFWFGQTKTNKKTIILPNGRKVWVCV